MAVESPFLTVVIGHSDVADFAAENINLRREDVEDYRVQIRLLREKLDRYAAEHKEHGLIKTLNDIDIAFYVEGNKVPSKEQDLFEWLAERVCDA